MRITHRQLVKAAKELLSSDGFILKEPTDKFKLKPSFVDEKHKIAFVCILPQQVLNKDREIRKNGYKMVLILPEYSTLQQVIKINTDSLAKFSTYQKKNKKGGK